MNMITNPILTGFNPDQNRVCNHIHSAKLFL